MAIEALLASPQAAPQPVDTKTAASKPAVTEAKAIVKHQPKPVPQAVVATPEETKKKEVTASRKMAATATKEKAKQKGRSSFRIQLSPKSGSNMGGGGGSGLSL